VTDIDQTRIDRAQKLIPTESAKKEGIELIYVNTKDLPDPVATLRDLNGGELFDDVFVFAPVRSLVEMADKLLGKDGCLNFFAGPTDPNFSAESSISTMCTMNRTTLLGHLAATPKISRNRSR